METKPVRDLSGQRFGRLTALRLAERQVHTFTKSKTWTWRSRAGAEVHVLSGSLTSGNTCSCGCLKRDAALVRESKKRSRACQ